MCFCWTVCRMPRHCSGVGSTPVGLCAHACSSTMEPSGARRRSSSMPCCTPTLLSWRMRNCINVGLPGAALDKDTASRGLIIKAFIIEAQSLHILAMGRHISHQVHKVGREGLVVQRHHKLWKGRRISAQHRNWIFDGKWDVCGRG